MNKWLCETCKKICECKIYNSQMKVNRIISSLLPQEQRYITQCKHYIKNENIK